MTIAALAGDTFAEKIGGGGVMLVINFYRLTELADGHNAIRLTAQCRRRQAVGVWPVTRRKAAANWLGFAKPTDP